LGDEEMSDGRVKYQLLEKKNWGFHSSRPVKNRIQSLQKDDIIIFYIGGQDCKYFAGEARIVSDVYSPNRETIGGPENYKLDFMVSFDNIDLWNDKKIYLTRNARDKLKFIKNKDNWGMTFGQAIIKISESDYCEIKKLINR
jgi:hypothetical protein